MRCERRPAASISAWRDRRHAARQRAGFAADRIAPRADEIDRSKYLSARSVAPSRQARCAGITVEEEWGGSGLGYLEHCVAMEEISRASGSVGLSMVRTRISASTRSAATPRRPEAPLSRQAHLRRACRPRSRCRSPLRLRRRLDEDQAEKKGDRYILNGSKIGSPTARRPTLVVYAKTDPAAGAARHHRVPDRKRASRILTAQKNSTNSASRLRYLRAGVQRIEVRRRTSSAMSAAGVTDPMSAARLRARGSGGRTARHHAGLHGRAMPYIHERKAVGRRSASFSSLQGKVATCMSGMNACKAYVYSVARGLRPRRRPRARTRRRHSLCGRDATRWRLDASSCWASMATSTNYRPDDICATPSLVRSGAGHQRDRRVLIGRELFDKTR